MYAYFSDPTPSSVPQQQPTLVFASMPISSTVLTTPGQFNTLSLQGVNLQSRSSTSTSNATISFQHPLTVMSNNSNPLTAVGIPSDLESDNDDLIHSHPPHPGMVHVIKDSSSPDGSPLASPSLLSPGHRTPCDNNYQDTNTQMSLVEVSSKLNLADEASHISNVDVESSNLWSMVDADHAEGVNQDMTFRKVRKSTRKSDASSCVHSEPEEELGGFDANGAIATQFVFSKFGTEVPILTTTDAMASSDTAQSSGVTSSSCNGIKQTL